MTDDQLLRYSRHILLEELGIEGQERLAAAHAVVIGAGGLGSPVALYLGTAGVGRITLVDGDSVDLTNLQRQIAHSMARIGRLKAESAREAIAAINPEVAVHAINERVATSLIGKRIPAIEPCAGSQCTAVLVFPPRLTHSELDPSPASASTGMPWRIVRVGTFQVVSRRMPSASERASSESGAVFSAVTTSASASSGRSRSSLASAASMWAPASRVARSASTGLATGESAV
ncbi:MAG: hypothetical protein EON92_07420, partial [Burkholderiales bacterium]